MKTPFFNHFLTITVITLLFHSCNSRQAKHEKMIREKLVDRNATTETVALYDNLWNLSEKYVLFGHQEATEYGRGWYGDENRSDVKESTGSHPAVIGHDFKDFTRVGQSPEEILKEQQRLAKLISATYDRGGIISICWHFFNPVQGKSFYWDFEGGTSARAVEHLIPGGSHHQIYKEILDRIGRFAHSVRGSDGKLVPMIFRPYHELDGWWFWWGKAHCTVEDFVELWRFTVSYLRDELKVRNFIYAFSPDRKFDTEEEFLERYPGDEWVDMIGMDNYGDFGTDKSSSLDIGIKKLKIVSDLAQKRQKLAAFTETGLESIPDTTWWTATLLHSLKDTGVRMSYVLVWRNDHRSAKHYYASPKGHPSHANFMEFYNDPFTLFEDDLPNVYILKF